MSEKLSYCIEPNYNKFDSKVKVLHQQFDTIGETLRFTRNHLKTTQWDGIDICIKSFKQANIFNQWIYGHIRGSKAKRSYLYALKLEKIGIHSPAPIAYIECRNTWGGITNSYYIYEYETVEMRISDMPSMELSYDEKERIINTFVHFTCSHFYDKGIYNTDFNGTNVLVSRKDKNIKLSFIDINRLRFKHKLSAQQELDNLNMVSSDPEILCMIAKAYAKIRNTEMPHTTYALFAAKYLKEKRRRLRKKAALPFKKLFAH